jgi:hypothetical protein
MVIQPMPDLIYGRQVFTLPVRTSDRLPVSVLPISSLGVRFGHAAAIRHGIRRMDDDMGAFR